MFKYQTRLLSLAVLGSLTQAANAGAYIGAGIGPDTVDYKQQSHVVYFNPAQPTQGFNVIDRTHLSGTGVFGTLFAGYSVLHNALYLAAEINGNLSGSQFRSSNAEAIHGSYSSTVYKLKNVFGISVLPGYQFSNTTLFYGRLGFADAKLRVVTSDTSLQNLNKWRGGFRWGLGGKQNINEQVALRLEYSQIWYKKANMYTFDTLSSVSKETTLKPMQQLVEFGLVYQFDQAGK